MEKNNKESQPLTSEQVQAAVKAADYKGQNFRERVIALQNELKAPKSKYNSFGKYAYRSCEDILTAVKPLCEKYGLLLNLSDTVELIGDRYYIRATASLIDRVNIIYDDGTEMPMQESSFGWAREDEIKKGMDGSQITGTASSYARKYALNGLLLIDDTKDADTDEYAQQTGAGDKPTPKLELESYIREVEGCKTVAALNAWWKNNRAEIPADILKQVYAYSKQRAEMLKQKEAE